MTRDAPPPVPDFAFQQNGTQKTLNRMLRSGPVLIVLFAPPAPEVRLEQLAAAQPRLATAGLRVVAVEIDPPGGEPRGPQSPLTGATSRDVIETLSLFAKPAPGKETELLIDQSGVRTRWTSDDAKGVSDIATLAADAAQVAAHPVAGLSQSGMAGMPGM